MQLAETHIALQLKVPTRLQEYAVGIFKTIPTKSGIKKAIKKKLVFVDGAQASTALFIKGGEKIELFQLDTETTFKRLDFPLEVLFEDDFLAIIYKPSGVLVSGNKFVTIANALAQNLQKSSESDAVKPQPIHRLDYPTSGVLLVGKTSTAITALSQLFETKEVQKTYHAICIGKMQHTGTIEKSIEDKAAQSYFEILKTVSSPRFKFLNLVKLSPKTGRRHQLRIHLSSIGNQILGDKEYGNPALILTGKGLYLHASTLSFKHPFTKENISITKELPKKFTKIFSN
jgi:23S rRNA pseudouridine1911/1915/1917 synthase